MIANQKIVFHGWRWNLESLDDECGTEESKDHGDDQGFEVLTRCRFFEHRFSHIIYCCALSRLHSLRSWIGSSWRAQTRSSACCAAACSAAFLVKPTPRAADSPSIITSTVNNF